MKKDETREIELFWYIEHVNKKAKKAIDTCQSAQDLKDEISNMCVKCFLPQSENCDICNWHSADQLFLNFEALNMEVDGAEEVK